MATDTLENTQLIINVRRARRERWLEGELPATWDPVETQKSHRGSRRGGRAGQGLGRGLAGPSQFAPRLGGGGKEGPPRGSLLCLWEGLMNRLLLL